MTLRLLLGLIVFFAGSAGAQVNKPITPLSPSLVSLHERYTSHLAQPSTAPFASQDPLVALVDHRVAIDATAADDASELTAELIGLGMVDAVAFGRIVSGHLPMSSIPALATVKSLRFARPAVAITNAGSVTSQGDIAMRSDVARTTLGVTGSGIAVGVLSDSFNCLGGAAADMSSGDLPAVTVLQEEPGCSSSGTDEGRAMLQIVHDVAPGAALAFATAFGGQANFANNIVALKNSGAKVIVDDVIYPTEPMFQDGIIAQAANGVVAAGVPYFSSAGNSGRVAYSSHFRPGPAFSAGAIPGAFFFWGGTAHNFSDNGTDVFQRVTLPAGAGFIMSLQWDSAAFSVSGAPGSPNDLDVYVLNADNSQVLAGSALGNVIATGGNGDPIEAFAFINTTGASADFNIMITKFEGADPGLIKYVLLRFGGSIQEFATDSGAIFGHANATSAQAVGAAAYFSTPAFGVSPPVLNSFSSSGTTPILFDTAGNRLVAPDLRSRKPEIVAPDGGDTTFFGTDTDGNGFPNFFGTSAAAPHAAGVAALLLESKPALSPLQVYASMENTAIDMDTPGFDNNTGFGLIQADAALAILLDGLGNISTRGPVRTGDNVMIGGFIIEGPVAKTVLIRSRGPSMSGAPFFVSGTLANPLLRIFSGSTAIAQNNDWQTTDPLCGNMGFTCGGPGEIAATGLDPCQPNPGQSAAPPNCARESAILITLPPGAYTAFQSGLGNTTGIGLIEVFEADGGASPSKLINISTRSRVESGDGVLIGGFIIGGSSVKTVGIRARGPSMSGAPFFVPGTLANPFMRLFSGSTVIAFNDNWQDLQPEEVAAAGLDPCEPNPGQSTAPDGCTQESLVIVSLPPGSYTAIVTGVGGGTGIGLVEVFELNDVAIPNVLGNYSGSATVTQSSCQNSANNGSIGLSSTVNMAGQTGSIFTGSGMFTGSTGINLDFSGTATAGSDLMGSFTFVSAVGSGNGTFVGALSGDSMTIDFSGQVTSGERCLLAGSITATR